MGITDRLRKGVRNRLDRRIARQLSKYGAGYPSFSRGEQPRAREPEPPYQRRVSPRFIYRLRQNSTLVNNAIEEKVSQTFRRGLTDIEKAWEAKCPNCKEEYDTLQPFYNEFSWLDEGDEVDFSKGRRCPDCDSMVKFKTPSKEDKEKLRSFLGQCNERGRENRALEPSEQNSVGQTMVEVFKEVGWDIQSFDDGWLIFERAYKTDGDGKVVDYDLKGVHRAPPDRMRYSIDENGAFGREYYVCVECRAKNPETYQAQSDGSQCSCGNYTYPAYAVSTDKSGRSGNNDPENFFIRGEFVHASEYEPSKYYGYSPILTLWDEASTLEKMDNWYREAYKERRAPRGAMIISSSNSESTRAFNKGEMEKLRNDPNYIPTFIDDSQNGEGGGKPIDFINLLETPAAMQHMEMREWFLDRISAKYGVTAVFQKGSPENAGLSQSMEIQVSNRSADRLRKIFNTTFFPAIVGQLGVEGWEVEVDTVEEEDEQEEAQLTQTHLKMAKLALEIGAKVEWTANDRADIKAGDLEAPGEGEEQGGMGLGEMMGEAGDEEAGAIPAQDEEQDPGPQGGVDGGMAPKPEEGEGDPRFQSPGKMDKSDGELAPEQELKMTRDGDTFSLVPVEEDDD
ncbi:portal protein [Haloarcula californiae tailed virus 1]|uniref:Portal protein n=1 Tax=Haloarcula californiae tailed virus 1 TaxID=1273746 RepID=R4T873_9CAUD|nr:portal protein [Haloarcula californiae tailed virus 1]AGM11964.1 portal protein [Haloarcula californiae tailed virus 1]